MLLKEIQPKINGKQSVLQFKGYNANAVIDDGEMRDMYNLSSDKYPVLSQRAPRNIIDMPVQHPRDIIVKNNVGLLKITHRCPWMTCKHSSLRLNRL